MPTYIVELEDGRELEVEADTPPTSEDLTQYFASQDPSQTQTAKKDLPFGDITDVASALGQAASSSLTTVPASFRQMYEGSMNPWEKSAESLESRKAMQRVAQESEAAQAEAEASGDASVMGRAIRSGIPSYGFTGAILPVSVAAGGVAGLGTGLVSKNPVAAQRAAMAAGSAASGVAAYRMAASQFMDDARERIDNFFLEKAGRLPNKQEQDEAYQELLPLAQEMGMAEALPEAFGNLALAGAGKYIYRILGGKTGVQQLASGALSKARGLNAAKALGAGAASTGVEVGTEGLTEMLNEDTMKKLEEGVMRGEDVSTVQTEPYSMKRLGESIEKVAEPTLATTAIMGLLGAGGGMAYRAATKQNLTESDFRNKMERQLQASQIGLADPEATAANKSIYGEKAEEAAAALKALDEGRTSDVEKFFNVRFKPSETIAEEPSMLDPVEVATSLNTASVQDLANANSPLAAKSQDDFKQAVAKALSPTEPAVQPVEEVETVEPEVTPYEPTTNTRPEILPENLPNLERDPFAEEETFAEKVTPLSEGAERNRAIIAEAAAKLRGEAPKTISAGVKAAIPQQPATSPNTPKFSEEALATSPVPETPPANITADTLPPIPEGMIRLTHGTSGQSIRDVLQSGRFNYSKQVVIDATTDSFGNNQDLAERLNTNMAGPMSREKFGDKVIIMDVPLDEYRKLRSFSADNPGFVPANRIVAVYDSNSKKLFAPELPQQSTSTTTQQAKENAPSQIPLEESLRQEPQDRAESREAEETGAGDKLRGAAEGEVQEEVISVKNLLKKKEEKTPDTIKAIHYSREPLNLSGEAKPDQDQEFGFGFYAMEPSDEKMWKSMGRWEPGPLKNEVELKPKKPLIVTPQRLKKLVEEAKKDGFSPSEINLWLDEQIRSGKNDAIIIRGFPDEAKKAATSKKIDSLLREKWSPVFPEGKTSGSFINTDEYRAASDAAIEEVTGVSRDIYLAFDRLQNQIFVPPSATPSTVRVTKAPEAERKQITPPGEPTTATEGMVTPGGVATERDLTKPEQMTPGESRGRSYEEWIITESRKGGGPMATGHTQFQIKVAGKQGANDYIQKLTSRNTNLTASARPSGKMVAITSEIHRNLVEDATMDKKPVSAAAVDTYGIKLPSGYVKQGDLYIFQPQTKQAAEAQPGLLQGNLPLEETPEQTSNRIKKQTVRFASGMSAIGDLRKGSYARAGHKNYGIGFDVGLLSKNAINDLADFIINLRTQVFIDSGAFSNFKKSIKAKQGDKIIAPLDFDQILAKYDAIISAIQNANEVEETDYPRPMLVMPDVIGNQAESLALIEKYKNWIALEVAQNTSTPIIPIPLGELTLSQAYGRIIGILNSNTLGIKIDPRRFVVGVPSNAEAINRDDLAQFLKESQPPRIHFLGAAADKNINPLIDVVAQNSPNTQVTADASKVRSAILNGVSKGKTRSQAIFDALYQEDDPSVILDAIRNDNLQTTAAEKQTPVPLREGTGAAGVTERQPSGGSIPEVAPSETQETQPSTKENDAISRIDRLVSSGAKPEEMDKFVKSLSDAEFNALVESEAFEVKPNLAIKPKDTYDAKRIKRRNFVDQINATAAQARKTAEQIFKEEEAALERQRKMDERTQASLNSIIDPEKTNIVQGTVSAADAESARRALNNSGEIPNAFLTRIYASPEAFLADRANQRYFPSSYARLQSEGNIEGLFERGQTLIFADKIGVSDLDRRIGKNLGISPEQAAARRVIAHENGHRSVALFTANEKREFLGYLRRKYNDAQIDNLVRVYSEYADWRTNLESRNEALEELFLKDFERLEKIPTGGLWDDIVEFLKRVWRRITGRSDDPTLNDMKAVVRLLRNAMRRSTVPSFTLNNGGEVKLSLSDRFQGVTPAQDAEYLAAVEAGDMEKAQRMVDEAAKRAGYDGPYFHGSDEYRDIFDGGAFFTDSKSDASGYARLRSIYKSAQENDELMEIVGDVMSEEGMEDITDMSPDTLIDIAEANGFELNDANGFVFRGFLNTGNVLDISDMGASGSVRDAWDFLHEKGLIDEPWSEMDEEVKGEILDQYQGKAYYRILEGEGIFSKAFSQGYDTVKFADQDVTGKVEHDSWITKKANQFKSADPVTRDDAGNVIPLSQRFQSASPDIRFSRVEYATDYSAAVSAGSQLARDTVYDDRIIEMRDAIRRAYEQSNTEAGVAMPIDELYAKAKEFAPDMTENEFGNILQDLYEDNGAVLQEGDVVEPLTEQDRRYLALAEDEDANQEELQRMVDEAAGMPDVFDAKNGIGQVPFNQDVDYRGFRKAMTQKEFRSLVPSGVSGPSTKRYVEDAIRAGKKIGQPFLMANWDDKNKRWIVTDHEGRSRIDAFDKVFQGRRAEVHIFPSGIRAKNLTLEMKNAPFQKQGVQAFGEDFIKEFGIHDVGKSLEPVTRDDQGRIIPLSRRFDTGADIRGQINVTTPEGRRAGFAIIMPKRAVASRVETEGPSVDEYKKKIEAINSNSLNAFFGGVQMKGASPQVRTVKPSKSYEQAAIELVNDLTKDGTPIEDIAESLFSEEFLQGLGIKLDIPALVSLIAEVKNRVSNQSRDDKIPGARRIKLQKLDRKLAGYWQDLGTNSGRSQGIRSYITRNPRYRWMFIFDKAEEQLRKDRELAATRVASDLPQTADNLQRTDAKAGEDAGEQVADDVEQFAESEDDTLLREGETALDSGRRSIWERMKDVLRKLALVARARKGRAANAAKASISKEERDAISQMSDAELAKMESDLLSEFDRLSEAFLKGGTEQQKATRKKMVATAKKRAEQGKPIEVTSVNTADVIDGIFVGFNDRDSIINEVGDALLKAAEQRKVKPKQKTAIQDLIAAIRQTLTANLKGEQIKADQPSLGKLLGKTFAQQGSEAALFAKSWEDGRKKVRAMLAEIGIDEASLDEELDTIMPPTPTLAYAPAAAKKAINVAIKEAGLTPQDALSNPVFFRESIMAKFNEAAEKDNLTEEGWNQSGKALAEKAVNEFIDNARIKAEKRSAESKAKMEKRKVEIADKRASQLIYSVEERFRQGSKDLQTSKSGDSINKAFRDQVKNPVSKFEFFQRLAKLNVSQNVSERLFKTAAREKADLQAMEVFRRLEGPNALQTMLREIQNMRRGEEIPLRSPIPWRKLLSQKASTVEVYRQRIFDAISSEESLADLDDAQKAKLADLFTQAWESKRKAILDRMVDNAINQEEAAGRLTQEGADALRSQRQKLVEDINLGILDEDRLMKHLADKFGIKSEFTEAERANIDRLLDILQDDKLNEVKRNKAAYELLEALSSATKIPIAKLLADYWVSSVLSGVNTAASIAMAVMSGGYELTTGAFRILRAGFTNPKELPAEIAASFKAMAEFLKAFGREGRLAWQYLVTGDRAFLDPSMNTVLNDLNYDSIGKTVSLAEKMAKSDKIMQRVMGIWMRSVSRLLTALDSFNSGVTKAGALPIVFRQLNLDAESLKQATEKYNLQLYRDRVIQRDFNGNKPTTAHDKALVDSYAKAEMMADLQEFGKFSENADFFGQQGAMTLDPTGVGGFIYSSIKSLTGGATNRADKFLAEAEREWKQADGTNKTAKGLQLALAYFLQFGAYNSANLAGLRFARFAGNKFNQGLSFIPGIGMLRMYEAIAKDSKIEAKDAFTDMIMRNQTAGILFAIIGAMALKAITDEPDDEKRGFFWNGGWANLTPDRKQQKLAAGQKEFTIGIPGGISFNYQNWPISPIMAAIGSLSDLARFSPEQWNEKSVIGRLGSAAASGVFSAGEIPALSGFQTLFGNNLSSKDPNEKRLDRFAKVMAGWGGGFVPRILKDIDFMADPGLRKYETLWEQTASHIPVYRRYSGEEYYDILGKQIERKVWPGSREFMELETDPEYRTLGKLNSRGIWLTPANAEHRMVGKGRNKRKLTQEEADAYSLETGKGYRQMLLRYGSRLEQMPTERARAFLMDKADEVRDRALKKIVR